MVEKKPQCHGTVQRCVKEPAALSKVIQKLYTGGVQEYTTHVKKKKHASNTPKHLNQEDEEGSSEPPPCRREQWVRTTRSLSTWEVCTRLCHPPVPLSQGQRPACPSPAADLQESSCSAQYGQSGSCQKFIKGKRLPLPLSRWHEALPVWGTSNLRIQWAFNTFFDMTL